MKMRGFVAVAVTRRMSVFVGNAVGVVSIFSRLNLVIGAIDVRVVATA